MIETTSEEIEIVPIGDVHLGNTNCKLQLFQKVIERITHTPNSYIIGMGDYIDAITPKDKRFDLAQCGTFINDQIEKMIELLKPIKDRILCLLTGNHDYKLHTEGYGDPVRRMCKELECDYAGYSCFVKLKVMPDTHLRSLIIYAHHGWSSGRRTGNVVNSVESCAQYWDADVYLFGHSHKLWSTRQMRIGWYGKKKVIFANTGSFLETCLEDTTGYGERAGYPPQKLGVLKIKYYPKSGDLHITE